MDDIEKEIKQITDGNANTVSKVKNMKITIWHNDILYNPSIDYSN